MSKRFIDLVTIEVHAGKGGDGIIAFRREKYVSKGGPNGGDGGNGGSVFLKINKKMTTLTDFRNGAIFTAEKGASGGSSDKKGRAGADTVLEVPPGTRVYDASTGELLYDLTETETLFKAVSGGKYGRGNAAFATSVNRAPRKCTKGTPGEIRKLRLELSLIADAGFVGIPNAGKSTLLSNVTSARPKIAGYPFTTIHPALGVVNMGRGFSFVLADLPGLIEDASEGVGLGLQFLRHVERNRILVYVVGAGLEISPEMQYKIVKEEVLKYDPVLAELDEIIILTKIDLLSEDETADALDTLPAGTIALSATSGAGVKVFLQKTAEVIRRLRAKD